MNRREILRKGVTAIAASSVVAGCSGDGGPNTEVTTVTGIDGDATSDVDGLEIISHRPIDGPYDGDFFVETIVENSGDVPTSVRKYNYDLRLFNSAGENINGDSMGHEGDADDETDPGETYRVTVSATPASTPDDVARYELTLDCEDVVGQEQVAYCQ